MSALPVRPVLSATLPPPARTPLDPRGGRPRIHDCMVAAAHGFGVELLAVASARRDRSASIPRQVGMYLALQLSGHTSTTIGRTLNRDASTVLHGERAVRAWMVTDPEFAARVEALVAALTHTSPRNAA
jgi:chromosomal replication initiation ATPase DnaA